MREGEGETEFQELGGDGIGRNSENSIRSRNCMEFREFDGTRSLTSRYVILKDDRVPGIGWDCFRGQN